MLHRETDPKTFFWLISDGVKILNSVRVLNTLVLSFLLCSSAFSFPLNLPDPRAERSGNLFYVEKCSSLAATIEGEGSKSFFIISKDEVKKLGVFFLNGGKDNVYTVRCGSERERIALSANQRKVLLLKPQKALDNVNYFYEISIKPERSANLHIKFITDRYATAVVCLENEEYTLAQMMFEELLKENPELIEARLYLGVVYERSGFRREAIKVFKEAMSSYPSLFKAYSTLGRSSGMEEDSRTFEDLFHTVSGMRVDEIRAKYHLSLIPWVLHLKTGVYGEGGAIFRAGKDDPGEMLYGPYMKFPRGPYTVRYTISSPGPACDDPVVRIDVIDYPKKLSERHISGNELTPGPKKFSISFFNEDPWAELEFRVAPNGKADIVAGEIDVYCDVQQSVRANYLVITESMKKLGIF